MGLFVHKRIISTVKTLAFTSDMIPMYIVLHDIGVTVLFFIPVLQLRIEVITHGTVYSVNWSRYLISSEPHKNSVDIFLHKTSKGFKTSGK